MSLIKVLKLDAHATVLMTHEVLFVSSLLRFCRLMLVTHRCLLKCLTEEMGVMGTGLQTLQPN